MLPRNHYYRTARRIQGFTAEDNNNPIFCVFLLVSMSTGLPINNTDNNGETAEIDQ